MAFRRKTIVWVLFAVVLVAIAGGIWWLRREIYAAPEATRLLPESDAVIYVNLRPLRLASAFASLPPVQRDPGYDDFVRATGFEFERDLDEAAVAVHLPSAAGQRPVMEARFSEVFLGRFDVAKLTDYFHKNAKSVEKFGGKEVFVVPVEDRTVRVALLSPQRALVSNVEDPTVLDDMIRRAQAIIPSEGPTLVRAHYKDVPLGSLAWAMMGPSRNLPLPRGFEIPMPAETSWVASVRYLGNVELEAQALTPSEQDAKQLADNLNSLLVLFHSLEAGAPAKGADPDVKAFFGSLHVQQQSTKTVLTATVPVSFLKKMIQEPMLH